MTDSYVAGKIKEALAATHNDKRDAQKLLITWAVRDQSLLLGLAKPHLKAIVAAQVDYAARPEKDKDEEFQFSQKDVSLMMAAKHPADKRVHKAPPPKASERQASVMHQIADAFRVSKKKDK